MEAELVVRPPAQGECHVGAIAEGVPQAPQSETTFVVGGFGQQDGDQTFAVGDEIGPVEVAPGLAGAPLAEGEQPAEPGVGGAIGRVDENGDIVGEVESTADDEPHAGRLGGLVRPDDPGERVAVDDAERLDAGEGRLRKELLAGRGAAQEAEVRGHLQFGVARPAHPKIPWRNQRCEPVARSSPSPAR